MLRSITAAVAAALTISAAGLTACSQPAPDPLESVPAFPVDAAAVSVIEQGENPQVLSYRDVGLESLAEAWGTQVEVAGGIAQAVVPEGDPALDATAPAGGDVMETTLPLTVTFGPAGAPGEGEADAARVVELTTTGGGHTDLDLGQEVRANEGFIIRWRAGTDGQPHTVKLLPPVDSPEAGRQVVERALLAVMSTVVVFPTEPVGVGGSWNVATRVMGDATIARTTTYTVRSIEGDVVELDVEVTEEPTQSTLRIDNEVAGELDGQTLTVAGTSTTSDGALTVDLTKPLPVAGRVAATTRLVYAGEGSPFRIIQDVTNAVTFASPLSKEN